MNIKTWWTFQTVGMILCDRPFLSRIAAILKRDKFACVDKSTAMNAHVLEAAHTKEASWLRKIGICDIHLLLVDVEERLINLSADKGDRMHPASVMRELMNAA